MAIITISRPANHVPFFDKLYIYPSTMKKALPILFSLLIMGALSILFLSSSGNPPNGKTGAPGEGTCADCHSMNGGGFAGMIEISGLPANIEAGAIYPLTLTASYSSGSPIRSGFQMTGLNGSDNAAGTLSNNSSGTVITTSGGRIYLEHNPAKNFNGAGSVSWTVDWEAPAGPDGDDITFYAASVIANGSGGNQGDDVVLTSVSGILSVAVEPLAAEISSHTDISCFGAEDGMAQVAVTGGQSPYSFSWDNGESANPAVNLGPGLHFVTVTDANGVNVQVDVLIAEPAELLITGEDVVDNSCPDSEDGSIAVDVSGGTPPYMFEWSNGETGAFIQFLPEGLYSVTVTDANDCSYDQNYQLITQFPAPDVAIVGPMEICVGTLYELSTNQEFVSYEWSTGENSESIFIDFPGLYEVTITDDNGCTGTAFIDVFELEQAMAVIEETSVDVCQGEGTVTLASVEPGAQYLWSTGEETPAIEVMEEGWYYLTVTNAGGCVAEASFEVLFPADLVASVDAVENILCFGEHSGSADLSASGGVSPYSFSLYDPQSGTTIPFAPGTGIDGLISGQYRFFAEDATGCVDSVDFVITEPEPLVSNLLLTNETSQGAQDGTAMVSPSGGTPPYMDISWSNGASGSSIDGLAPGNYSVSITDANACLLTENFTIQSGDCALTASSASVPVSCFGESDGSLSVNLTGGTEPYQFSWSTGTVTQNGMLENLPAGDYQLTVTDAGQCTIVIDGLTVSQPEEIIAGLFLVDESLIGAADGMASVMPAGGVAPYDVLWSNGEAGDKISGLVPGNYSVTITDANGCMHSEEFIIMPSDIADGDQDGYGSDVDCDDTNPDINPGAEEIANNQVDENCDGVILIIDADSDGYHSDEDCDDSNPDINPGAAEIPGNGIDEDCDGEDGSTATFTLPDYDLVLFPNPANERVYIGSAQMDELDVQVYSYTGQRMEIHITHQGIDVSGLKTGIYLIRISNPQNGAVIVKNLSVIR